MRMHCLAGRSVVDRDKCLNWIASSSFLLSPKPPLSLLARRSHNCCILCCTSQCWVVRRIHPLGILVGEYPLGIPLREYPQPASRAGLGRRLFRTIFLLTLVDSISELSHVLYYRCLFLSEVHFRLIIR
jgi:hypothetical protein